MMTQISARVQRSAEQHCPPRQRRRRPHRRARDRIRSLATDFPALWSNPHLQRDRKPLVRLLASTMSPCKTDRIHLHVRFPGGQTTSLAVAIPPKAWQVRQTHPDTLAALDRLLDTHTDAQTAEHSTPPVTAPSRAVHRPHRAEAHAAATSYPAMPSDSAPTACSLKPSSPHGWACTRSTVKS